MSVAATVQAHRYPSGDEASLTAPGDTGYLHRVFAALDDAMRRAAATYVDMPQGLRRQRRLRWRSAMVEPTLGAVSFPAMHANARGQQATADQVVAALR